MGVVAGGRRPSGPGRTRKDSDVDHGLGYDDALSTERADAVERGDLIAVSGAATGRSPMAFTREAWDMVVYPPEGEGDFQARLEAVLRGFREHVLRFGVASSRVIFGATVAGRTKRLVAVYGPDDDRRPAVTIQMPWEDRG